MVDVTCLLAAPRRRSRTNTGFTLIELLVVISIIALLIGILLPALGAARGSARSIASLSNLRQIGIGMTAYSVEHKDYLPMHSSTVPGADQIQGSKPRWADFMHEYMNASDVFLSPNLDERERSDDFMKPMWHSVSSTPATIAARDLNGDGKSDGGVAIPGATPVFQGGYGYNFQYLGNARPLPTYHARFGRDIIADADTVVVGDTAGSRDGNATHEPGQGGAAVYALDPPIGSVNLGSKGNGNGTDSYYEGGSDENAGSYDPDFEYVYRSAPAQRNTGNTAGFTFADGHSEQLTRADIDDFDDDGTADNGYWNGRGDPTLR